MRERLWFWRRVLLQGTGLVNAAAGWAGTILLGLGAIAGITVPLVFHLSHWLIAVILLILLVVVTAEGGYQVWHESDRDRKAAEAERDEARRDEGRDARKRSVAAAMRLADLVAGLDWSVGLWQSGDQDPVSSELAAAYKDFAQAEAAATGELTDQELRKRVHSHSLLVGTCLKAIGEAPQCRPQVARLLRDHAKSISKALTAHQQGTDLPPYVAPSLETPVNLTALFAWQSAV
jgi:hypothetical protein